VLHPQRGRAEIYDVTVPQRCMPSRLSRDFTWIYRH
jgi:hypothetical protein